MFFRYRMLVALLVMLFILHQQFNAQPLADGKSKFVGNIIGNGFSIRTNFKDYWNQVTPENAGKWGSVESSQGVYNWSQLDNIYNYAKSNGFPYKHHTLVWGAQQPGFINSLDSASQYEEIAKWIDTTAKRYPDIDLIDVVNEPLPGHAPPDGGGSPARANYKKALGGDGVTGWDWVIKAFELARQSWPASTKLLINDYGILNSAANTLAYRSVINLLKDRGLIDGIGCQAHGFESVSAGTIKANLDTLAKTGLPIYISEFDLNIQDDAQQLAKYKEVFPVFFEHPAVEGITLWGYVENETWLSYSYLLTQNLVERPAMQWLHTYFISPIRPVLISPTKFSVAPLNISFTWNPSETATSYRFQISQNSAFSTLLRDNVVTDTLFHIDSLKSRTLFYWRVNAMNDIGESPFSLVASFYTQTVPTEVKEEGTMPDRFALLQNYPNPFNPTTTIRFSLPVQSHVRLFLTNTLGQTVKEISDGMYSAGDHQIELNASHLTSGVYFYRMETTTGFVQTRKLVLLK